MLPFFCTRASSLSSTTTASTVSLSSLSSSSLSSSSASAAIFSRVAAVSSSGAGAGALLRRRHASSTATTVHAVDPTHETPLDSFAADADADIERKLSAAQSAQRDWLAVTLAHRKEIFRRFAAALMRNQDKLSSVLTTELGKPKRIADAELRSSSQRLAFFVDYADVLADEQVVYRNPGWNDANPNQTEELVRRSPLGVVAHLSNWHTPVHSFVHTVTPALLAGNAVLYKPSSLAHSTGRALCGLLVESGVPEGLVELVCGDADAGRRLVAHNVDGIFFTGSSSNGAAIVTANGGRARRLNMQQGGADLAYVTEDCDFTVAAKTLAVGAFYNNGASPTSVEHILVHKGVASRFIDVLVEQVSSLRVGDPSEERTFCGPLASRAELERIEALVEDARAKGAKVLVGGTRGKQKTGFFYTPTVLADVTDDMLVARDEIAGPIVCVNSVANDQAAVDRMRAHRFGLGTAMFCRYKHRATDVLEQAPSGSVYWNCCDRVSPRLPFTGRGDSGTGVAYSLAGMEQFYHTKAWHMRYNPEW